jgi:hypothetical protein
MRDETPTDDQLLDAAAYAAAVDLLTGSRHVRGRGQGRPTDEDEPDEARHPMGREAMSREIGDAVRRA